MISIADITNELAVALFRAISRHNIHFVAGTIPYDPPSRHKAVNALLYGSPLLSHSNRRRINFCNYEATKIFGKTIDEMLGMPSDELAPDVDNIREDRASYLKESLKDPVHLSNARRWQWQPDGGKKEILIDATVFPYEYKGIISSAASITLKGYYQP
ncbi:hypothetical protein CMO83_03135 [Candidatus Woesearchaeota archaeon]|jgi:PAS domain-containing protein|nr:hypothetical protein [Candidatus Woesearchaeota archaeon]|tara:strand:+ start:12133 stop:12606 length:474 start_codon:yes stop_codon:yes gene_type:complete